MGTTKSALSCSAFNYTDFNAPEDILAELQRLAERFPNRTLLRRLGNSTQNRPIIALEVVSRCFSFDLHMFQITASEQPKNASIIWIDSGIHAREWLTQAVAMNLIHRVLSYVLLFLLPYCSFQLLQSDTNLTSNLTFVIAPVVNLDGYVETWQETKSGYTCTIDFACRVSAISNIISYYFHHRIVSGVRTSIATTASTTEN